MQNRKPYNVGAWKIEPENRDVFREHVDAPDTQYEDVFNSTDEAPVGSQATMRVWLDEPGVEAFRGASNLRYLEEDEEVSMDAHETLETGETITEAVPDLATMKYHCAQGLEADGYDGSGTIGAVGDTGASGKIVDVLFEGRVVAQRNFTDSPTKEDEQGHFSMVAPMAIPSGAKAVFGKVLGDNGRGSNSAIAKFIYWAVEQGADCINLSLSGGPKKYQVFEEAATYAHDHGCVLVCSSGNDGKYQINAPANSEHAAASIAFDKDSDRKASFSNYHEDVWLSAAGQDELSYNKDGELIRWSGTSASAPNHTRLILMGSTKYAAKKVERALGVNGRDTKEPTQKEGGGVAQLRVALKKLESNETPGPTPPNPPKIPLVSRLLRLLKALGLPLISMAVKLVLFLVVLVLVAVSRLLEFLKIEQPQWLIELVRKFGLPTK